MVQKSSEAFRTISEVATHIDVPQHVLRFWETKFSQIKPVKRAGGRRFYRPNDVDLIKGIQTLLYEEGYTIKGVQRILKEQGVRFVVDTGRGVEAAGTSTAPIDPEAGKAELPVPPATAKAAPISQAPGEVVGLSDKQKDSLKSVLADLVALKAKVIAAKASASLDDDAPLLARARD
ncbi:MAG: MerR family transcriptional regulator [Alphaproteobacteria bacterium]|nr:MAG: MerR family transcriptional regulator [Alphaproteobacteria bacterium]